MAPKISFAPRPMMIMTVAAFLLAIIVACTEAGLLRDHGRDMITLQGALSNISQDFQSQIAAPAVTCSSSLHVVPLPIQGTVSCLVGQERCVSLTVFGDLCTTPGIKLGLTYNGPRSGQPFLITTQEIGFFGTTLTNRLILPDTEYADIFVGFDVCWDPLPTRCSSGVAVNTCQATYGGRPCESCRKTADGGAVFTCIGIEFNMSAPSFPTVGGKRGAVVMPNLAITSLPPRV